MFLKAVLDIIYPPRCVYCYDILGVEGPEFLCELCENEIECLSGNVCKRCGHPSEKELEACYGCRKRNFYISRNHALFIYEGNIREALLRFKYKNKKRYAKYFGLAASKRFKKELSGVDLIIGVPLHKAKLNARGYNQADLLAAEMAKNLGVLHMKDVIKRVKNTKPQSKLSGYAARENNIKDAFIVSEGCNIRGKRIVIVDDIFTTGSTLNECAKTLMANGAESVVSVTISITVRDSNHD